MSSLMGLAVGPNFRTVELWSLKHHADAMPDRDRRGPALVPTKDFGVASLKPEGVLFARVNSYMRLGVLFVLRFLPYYKITQYKINGS